MLQRCAKGLKFSAPPADSKSMKTLSQPYLDALLKDDTTIDIVVDRLLDLFEKERREIEEYDAERWDGLS